MGPVAAAGGGVAATLAAADLGSGAGGAIGALLARVIETQHAEAIAEQLDHGGLLLWVRTWDDDHEKKALEILSRHSGQDVHVHGLKDSA